MKPTRNASAVVAPVATLRLIVAAAAFAAAGGACHGAQVKESTGEVKVVLRRIDVVQADFDKMKLNVIVAVENGTADDVSVDGSADISIAGEATDEGDDDEAGEAGDGDDADDGEGDDAKDGDDKDGDDKEGDDKDADDAKVPEEKAPASSAPVDSAHYSGHGAGRAAAFNTSELPIAVDLPLPSDPASLETVLGWAAMKINVEATLKLGALTEKKLSGVREVAPPHIPEVKLKEAQVASVDNGTAGTGFFTLLLDNKNPFPVTIDKLAWTITIKDKQLQPQNGPLIVDHDSVPASAAGAYSAEVQINDASFGKDLKAILKSPSVPYIVDGTLEVRGIEKSFHFAGDMKFPR